MANNVSFGPPRGMRDFYPEDMRVRNCIFNAWRQAAQQSAFEPYDACVVESLPLLKRKAGEEIVDQIYHFKDKSNRDLALRPEMTPSLARMVAARQGALSFPLKWFTIAQCFRYERMTRGRKREHYQWNLDIIGESSVQAEVEILYTATLAMQNLGLSDADFCIHFNSRTLLVELLAAVGIQPEHHQAAFMALDKRGKIDDTAIANLLQQEGCPPDLIKTLLNLLELSSLEEITAQLPHNSPALEALHHFTNIAETYGLSPFLKFDIGVIRGLAYYTGIVFEAFDRKHGLRAIFGGGRYDKLLSSIGGNPTTAVGLGFGDVVIAELLDACDKTAQLTDQPAVEYAIGYMDDDSRHLAISVATRLRNQKHTVDIALCPVKPRNFFAKAANRAANAILIGPDDVAAGSLRVKNLADRSETSLLIDDLLTNGS